MHFIDHPHSCSVGKGTRQTCHYDPRSALRGILSDPLAQIGASQLRDRPDELDAATVVAQPATHGQLMSHMNLKFEPKAENIKNYGETPSKST